MTVRIEVEQERTIEGPDAYRVETGVTYVEGIDSHIFVYEVAYDTFSYVAYPYDIRTYPRTKQEAIDAGLAYYRQLVAIKDYPDEVTATEAAIYTLNRIECLATAMNKVNNDFIGKDSHVFIGV